MAFVAPSRLNAIKRLQCSIFQTTYNPTNIRTGAKYLRARLRGPAMMQYYPPTINLAKVMREFPELEIVNEHETQRLIDVADKKRRGKGPPKKKKEKVVEKDVRKKKK